jgi:hypothetical protein
VELPERRDRTDRVIVVSVLRRVFITVAVSTHNRDPSGGTTLGQTAARTATTDFSEDVTPTAVEGHRGSHRHGPTTLRGS